MAEIPLIAVTGSRMGPGITDRSDTDDASGESAESRSGGYSNFVVEESKIPQLCCGVSDPRGRSALRFGRC